MSGHFAHMKTSEIISSLLSWLFAAVGMLMALIYGVGNINPHGSSTSQPMPFHLFILPVAALALAAFVLFSTYKRGIVRLGFVVVILPLAASLLFILDTLFAAN